MKNSALLIFTFILVLTSIRCGDEAMSSSSSSGNAFTISGTLEGATSMQVYLDKIGVNPSSANTVIGKTEADTRGMYKLVMTEPLEAGLYRLRVGEQRVTLVLDGTEKEVTLDGQLAALNQFVYNISGSEGSKAYQTAMQDLVAKRMSTAEHVQKFVDTTPNPITGLAVAVQSLGNNTSNKIMEIHRSAQKRVKATYPNSNLVDDYASYIAELQKVKARGNGYQFIAEGDRQIAPDIRLPDPNGKEYALSDLKGKVVLLDFWASWCGPCRRENPNVVKIYEKYKDQGFTVFSVSLDGIDSRQKSRMNNDQKLIAQANEAQKKRWVDAIKKDGLTWEYHVSELKKWESPTARQYGVSSIPRTFMIDKEGKIAAVNLRGEAIEETILKLL